MRRWLAACAGLLVLVGLAGCSSTGQEGNDVALAEEYLQAIVDGRLEDAAAMSVAFDDDDWIIPQEAYLAAGNRVDGFTAAAGDSAVSVTIQAGGHSRSGPLYVVDNQISESWIWHDTTVPIAPSSADAALNGVPVAPLPGDDRLRISSPAGDFEVTMEAGPFVAVAPVLWEFGLTDAYLRPSTAQDVEVRLSEEGVAEAGRLLEAILEPCRQDRTGFANGCPNHLASRTASSPALTDPDSVQWIMDEPELVWEGCTDDQCLGYVREVSITALWTEGGEPRRADNLPWSLGPVRATINPDRTLEVAILGAG